MAREYRRAFLRFILAFSASLAVSSAFILGGKENPLAVWTVLLQGALSGQANVITTLRWSTPYILTGLAACIALRAGMFNLGVDGCIYIGGLASALVGAYVKGVSRPTHVTLALLAAMLAGAIWVAGPALLRAYRGISEVVTSWMFSYMGILLAYYLVAEKFQDPTELAQAAQQVRTPYVADTAKLSQLVPPYQLNSSLIIALVLVVLTYVFFSRTKMGYEFNMTGLMEAFAKYGGIKTTSIQLISMLISGAIGGLAGASEVLGVHYRYIHGFSNELGSTGILIAIMGRLHPVGVLASALFMGVLQAGVRAVQRTSNVSLDTVLIMISMVVIFITAEGLYEMFRLKEKAGEGE